MSTRKRSTAECTTGLPPATSFIAAAACLSPLELASLGISQWQAPCYSRRWSGRQGWAGADWERCDPVAQPL